MCAFLIPDLAVARRVEAHEAWSASSHALTQASLFPTIGADALHVGHGYAVYCGSRSPNNGLFGWGLEPSAIEADLDSAETFFSARQLDCAVRLCPLAEPDAVRALSTRGYRARDFMNVYVRRLDDVSDDAPAPADLNVRPATSEEARAWFIRAGYAGPWADPEGVDFMLIRSCLKPGSQLFLAWQGHEAVGGGALEIRDGTAALMAAMTSPYLRGRGIHAGLLQARLRSARAAGCDLGIVHTRPGADSARNVLRAGFQLAYTTVTLVRDRNLT